MPKLAEIEGDAPKAAALFPLADEAAAAASAAARAAAEGAALRSPPRGGILSMRRKERERKLGGFSSTLLQPKRARQSGAILLFLWMAESEIGNEPASEEKTTLTTS